MDYSLLDEAVIKILKKAGWNKRRKVDITRWVELLLDEGYTFFPYAGEILEEFGWLSIRGHLKKSGKKTRVKKG